MTKQIRLWVINHTFHPVWSGPAERFARYGRGLAERGIDTTIVTPVRERFPRNDTWEGTRVLRVGNPDAELLSPHAFMREVAAEVLRAKSRPDIVLSLMATSRKDAPVLWTLRALGAGTIYVRTMAYAETNGQERLPIAKFLELVDWTVSSNESIRLQTIARGVPRERTSVIRNGVSLARFRPPGNPDEVCELRRSHGLPTAGPIILYVGLMIERKGLLDLLRGFTEYRTNGGAATLVLVGQDMRLPDDEAFQESLEGLIAGGLRDGSILRLPPSKRVEELYRAADVFAFLSKVEGMPNVILEALATGLPVLTTRFDGFSDDLGRDGSELMISGPAPEEVARRLGGLLSDGESRARMGKCARAWMEAHHDLERSLDAYAELCRRVAHNVKKWHRGLLGAPAGMLS